jgi:hypothetical protein
MRQSVRSIATNSVAIAAASTLAMTFASAPVGRAPTMAGDVRLSAATTAVIATPPPAALIEHFVVSQLQNCSLICPFIIQGVIQMPINYAIFP